MHTLGVRVAESQYELPGTRWTGDAAGLLELVTFISISKAIRGVSWKREAVDEIVVLKWAIRFILD